jgi:hypothetical protein
MRSINGEARAGNPSTGRSAAFNRLLGERSRPADRREVNFP